MPQTTQFNTSFNLFYLVVLALPFLITILLFLFRVKIHNFTIFLTTYFITFDCFVIIYWSPNHNNLIAILYMRFSLIYGLVNWLDHCFMYLNVSSLSLTKSKPSLSQSVLIHNSNWNSHPGSFTITFLSFYFLVNIPIAIFIFYTIFTQTVIYCVYLFFVSNELFSFISTDFSLVRVI